jgi:hypothetical protein
MGLFSRFFGRSDSSTSQPVSGPLVANPDIKQPLSLQVLFPTPVDWNPERITQALRGHHRGLSGARCELEAGVAANGQAFGLAGWGEHVVRLVGFNAPMPADAVESCVAPSHYPQELKDRVRAHRAHLLLYYVGRDASPLEHYVALATVAGALAKLGGLVVLNETAHTSFPLAALAPEPGDGDLLELLRTLPLCILYCGFVKHEVEGVAGVWMRTYGCPSLGLPDFAAHASGHHEGQRYFELFENVLGYLRRSGARLAAGHTMQVGENEHLRARAPNSQEAFLQSAGELLVLELIRSDQINR